MRPFVKQISMPTWVVSRLAQRRIVLRCGSHQQPRSKQAAVTTLPETQRPPSITIE
jgi:hypothetical protein